MRKFLFYLFLIIFTNSLYGQSPLCSSYPTSFCCEYVSSITINGRSYSGSTGFTSGSGGTGPNGYYDYADSSNAVPTITAGQQINISYTAVTSSTYREYFKLWIDFNGNGNLSDPGELVHSVDYTWNGTRNVSATFTVPTTVYNGTVYMRFIMVFSNSPSLCGAYSYGNTFDFVTNITGAVQPPYYFSHYGKIDDTDGNGVSGINVELYKKTKASSTFSLHDSFLTGTLGGFEMVTTLDTSDYDFQLRIPSFVFSSLPVNSDAFYFNQKILNGGFLSKDYYSGDVNLDNSISISDIYGIFQRTNGNPWKTGVPSYFLFTQSNWNSISSSTSNLKNTLPGGQSLIINSPISSDTTNFKIIRMGFED